MKTLLKQLIIVGISSGLVACSATPSAPGEGASRANPGRSDCISRSSIRGYNVLDDKNLIVDAMGRRKYHLQLSRRAFGLRSSWGIGFDTRTSQVCAGFSDVVFEGHLDNESIRISSIRRLSPQEHEDLLIQFGKKEPEIKQTPVPREVEGAQVEELDPTADGN